jgi:predicted phosphoribosyltransferase
LALSRGGAAVGYQLSLGLHLPLGVFIAQKLKHRMILNMHEELW